MRRLLVFLHQWLKAYMYPPSPENEGDAAWQVLFNDILNPAKHGSIEEQKAMKAATILGRKFIVEDRD